MLTSKEAATQISNVRTFIASALREGEDYGKIQGSDRSTLYLPGAQKICMLFEAVPQYEVQRLTVDDGHIEYIVTTSLVSKDRNQTLGCGVGSCTSLEKKYRYRKLDRTCPKCGKATIRQGKDGFYCPRKGDGCGANFAANDKAILEQQAGLAENTDVADLFNTILKMAKKRSFVDAVISLACVGETFTQDIGDPEALTDTTGPAAETPDKPIDWNHPQARRWKEVYELLVEESGHRDTESEESVRIYLTDEWTKLIKEVNVDRRPDVIPDPMYERVVSGWVKRVREGYERKRATKPTTPPKAATRGRK